MTPVVVKRWLSLILIPSLAFALIGQLLGIGLIQRAPAASDVDSSMTRAFKPTVLRLEPNPKIVLVLVGPGTKSALGLQPPDGPLDRRVYAELIGHLELAGASVFLSDIAFTSKKPEQDAELAKTVRGLRKLKCVFCLSEPDATEDSNEPDKFAYFWQPNVLEPFASGGSAVAAHGLTAQFGDTVSAVFALRKDHLGNRQLPHSAVAAAAFARSGHPGNLRLDAIRLALKCDGLEWALGPNFELPLQWTKEEGLFTTYSLEESLQKMRRGDGQQFEGKIVLLGDDRGRKTDWHLTDRTKREPGYEVLANALNTALESQSGRYDNLHQFWDTSLSLFFGALMSATILWSTSKLKVLLVVGIGGVTFTVLALLLVSFRLEGSPFVWLSTLVVSAVGAGVLALARGGALDLRASGQTMHVTAMFLDLRDSTPLAHELGPVKFQEVFSEIQDQWNTVIARHHGTVERSMGDGVFAIFSEGSPVETAVNAGRAALELLDVTAKFGDKSGFSLQIGIGLESGVVSGGFVREGDRQVWSTAGSVVVAAQRIQTLTKRFGRRILAGPGARALVAGEFGLESVGEQRLKGLPGKTELFAVNVRDSQVQKS